MLRSGQFVFRKNAVIGAAAAENDEEFLANCFIDTGDLETLADMKDYRRIVLGRTGSENRRCSYELETRDSQFGLPLNHLHSTTLRIPMY